MSSAHAVELADTHRETKSLSHQALDLVTCGRRMALAVIQYKGEDLPAQFDWVAVASFDEGERAFTLHTLQESVHGRAMHRNRTAPPCL